MSWKQPVPVDVISWFGMDYNARNLYLLLLLRVANRDGVMMAHGGKVAVKVPRGYTVFGKNEYAKLTGLSPISTYRVLLKLQNMYQRVILSPSKSFTLVELVNYDDISSFDTQDDTQVIQRRDTGDTEVKPSKSVKSDKSVKNTPPAPQGEEPSLESHPTVLAWKAIVGTTLRTDLKSQVKAAERLKALMGGDRVKELLMGVRMIRADDHAGTFLKLTANYVQLEKKLEAVEAYVQGATESHAIKSTKRMPIYD